MAGEDATTEKGDILKENKNKENLKSNEETTAVKRSFDGNSGYYQPETKKIAMSSDNSSDKRVQPAIHHHSNISQNNQANGNAHVTEYIYVPDRMVGLLIGKGGEQITAIQNECQCRAQFAPETGSPQRQCTLSGPAMNVEKAKKMIDELILKNQLISLGGDEVALEIMIPGNKVGLMIGKNGDTIRQLQEKSGARVAIIQDTVVPSDYEKPLRISGSKSSCHKARDLVMELLNDNNRGGSGGGVGNIGMSGGPGMMRGGMGPGMKHNIEIPVPRNLVGIVIGKGGEMIKKIQEESGAKVQFRPDDLDDTGPNRVCHIYGFKQNNDVAFAMIHDLIKTGMNRQNGGTGMYGGSGGVGGGPYGNAGGFQNGMIHMIPTEKCGLVIGKGGENIKEINRITGAHAELVRDMNNGADGATKRFKITGNPEQIQHCIALINEKAGLPPPISNTPVYGSMPSAPPMVNPYAPINPMPPAQQGAPMVGGYGAPQMVLPNQTVYSGQVPQTSQWQASVTTPTVYPQQQIPAQVNPYNPQAHQNPAQPSSVYVDSSKPSDPNAAALAYYAQWYPSGQPNASVSGGQPAATAVAINQPTVQTAPIQQAAATHPSVAYATTTQVIAAPVQPGQPQPTINPQTGQADYSLAWAEYYRAQGLHQQAAAVMQAAGLQPNQ